jgi:hypothetical protein
MLFMSIVDAFLPFNFVHFFEFFETLLFFNYDDVLVERVYKVLAHFFI